MKWFVEVWYKSGVTDAVGDSVKKGISDLGIKGIEEVRAGQKYSIQGKADRKTIERICKELLANGVVQDYKISK
ncbi:MAG: phosphoribosylformylglycinamidine synthase subunit PurS [Candidatus Firestonebacteria bacterium]